MLDIYETFRFKLYDLFKIDWPLDYVLIKAT